jgi:gluconolactonase
LPANHTATLIKANAGSLEGPVWVDAQSALFFCVVSGAAKMGRIDKLDPATGQLSTFATGVDVAGLALSPQGALIAASFDSRNLTSFDLATARRTGLPGSDSYLGKPFDQTNDLVIRSDGNIYFTDTDYRQDGRPGQETTAYYRLSPAGKVTRLGAGPEPNGIALSPDGRSLYVSSTGGDPLRRFTLDDEGATVGPPVTFASTSSDGMAVDCAGNLYLSTAGTIRVLGPDGKTLGTIDGLGGGTVSNAAFGGRDHKTLFITTASALYRIELDVPGFPS